MKNPSGSLLAIATILTAWPATGARAAAAPADPRTPIVTVETRTVSDPVRGTSGPLSIPGSRQSTTITVTNPDVVALDADSLVLTLPLDRNQGVAFETGADGSATVELTAGTEHGMRVAYGGPEDVSDDVEWSADGSDWSLRPTDALKIRAARIRIRGTLGPSRSVSVALATRIL